MRPSGPSLGSLSVPVLPMCLPPGCEHECGGWWNVRVLRYYHQLGCPLRVDGVCPHHVPGVPCQNIDCDRYRKER